MKRTLTALIFGAAIFVENTYAKDFDNGADAPDNVDYAEVIKSFRVSAEQGDAAAQYNLGWMYDAGKGVTKDQKEAVKWYRLSAEQGYTTAQYTLGMMYALGQGVIQDLVYAHMWSNIAAANGHPQARDNRDMVAKSITPSQLAEAQKLARECVAKDYEGC